MKLLKNFVGGSWLEARPAAVVAVSDPATGQAIASHPMSVVADVDAAVESAVRAFEAWSRTPVPSRAAILFHYRHLVWEARDELATIIVKENGKTKSEALGELLRALQYVEHASAAPETMKGSVTENVGSGVDTEYIREPLGPFAVVAPFNFPAMIPLYFTWAVATGNTVVLKPSEHCPLTTIRLVELAVKAGFPPGVVNMVLGDKAVVERLCSHPDIVGVSFVGSSEIAEIVYKLATGNSKRCQAQGGSKNHLVVTDSAVIDKCLPNIVSSMLGNASQRCFAGSNLLIYESVYEELMEKFLAKVGEFRLGYGLDERSTLGPVISPQSRLNLEVAVDDAVAAGAEIILDGRGVQVDGYAAGNWIGPTLVSARPGMKIFDKELFGPVRCIMPVRGLDDALDTLNLSTYGHTAAIYTEHGGVAREFRQRAQVGQVGVNVGTPAPIAFYAVGGRKSSFYGSLRGRANDAIDFYTDKKVLITTWHYDSTEIAAVDPAFEGS